jgi:CheY-like chemotaxis protein
MARRQATGKSLSGYGIVSEPNIINTDPFNMAKILVIDDEKSIRNTLTDILAAEDHEVLSAEDGPTGLELYVENKLDVVLCDIKMQEMDGMEVLEKYLNNPRMCR